jgi:type II secretory ATPase GspE/PulE/Tfp pilus assembly ATPase PilB-like protein
MSEAERALGDRLYRSAIVSRDQLRIAHTEQAATGEPLERVLTRLGFVDEAVVREQLGDVLDHASVDLDATVPDAAALRCLDKAWARRLGAVPVSWASDRGQLTVAMTDPSDLRKLDRLRAQLGPEVSVRALLAGERALERALERFYGYALSVDAVVQELETGQASSPESETRSGAYRQPVVRLIDALLADAVQSGASDVHFEPEAGFVRIRYRIDGVLRQVRSLHGRHWSPMSVRLKVMADLDIADTRAPQDGRISRAVAGRDIEFRVSVVRTVHGENIVLRILDRQKGIPSLDALGLPADTRDALDWLCTRPEGLVLVTGPTGSGKTTTLYALLAAIDHEALDIVTLEDPVEYPLPRVRQSAVNEAAGLDFANGVRQLMRQDPDIMLVGEIRDEATASMALRAAMTGHQVYATLHTHSALGAVPRLLDIGIRPEMLAEHTMGLLGQRLVRRLCPQCKQPGEPSAFERRLMGGALDGDAAFYRPAGCTACAHQGYSGRFAVAELIRIDADFEALIARRASRQALAEAARAQGLRTLAAEGVRHVAAGHTALAEVARVIDLTNGL